MSKLDHRRDVVSFNLQDAKEETGHELSILAPPDMLTVLIFLTMLFPENTTARDINEQH